MVRAIRENFGLLSALSRIKRKQDFKIILRHLDSRATEILGETFWNVIYNKNLNLPKRESAKLKNILKRGRKSIFYFTNKRKSVHRRKKLLEQRGGFLAAILSAAIPLIVGLLARHGASRQTQKK